VAARLGVGGRRRLRRRLLRLLRLLLLRRPLPGVAALGRLGCGLELRAFGMEDPSQQLQAKEAAAFRSISRLHDQKLYKRALKTCDAILKAAPEHGETLAFKALTLSNLGRKEEAYALAKLGLMKTKMRSNLAWHFYGLIYRADRNYVEAIKCYRASLRLRDAPRDALTVQRELAVLQVQTRDLKGFCETRKVIFTAQAQLRTNWIGLRYVVLCCCRGAWRAWRVARVCGCIGGAGAPCLPGTARLGSARHGTAWQGRAGRQPGTYRSAL
jgi:tetratricopeptide (TPR) repeat protein